MYQVTWIDKEGALCAVNSPCIYAFHHVVHGLWALGYKVRTWQSKGKGQWVPLA